jgi:exoribonuclease II
VCHCHGSHCGISNSARPFRRREGADLPAIPLTDNRTISDDSADWLAAVDAYSYQHANAVRDPNLWVIKAEERQAWATEAVLIDNNPGMFTLPHFPASIDDASICRLLPPHYNTIHRCLAGGKLSGGRWLLHH